MSTRDTPPSVTALLWAARETGALEALLTSADTAEAVADETGVTERAARVVVDVLADEGFLERVGDAYEPTNRALGLLTKTDLRSIGPLPHQLDVFDAYVALPETMRDGSRPDRPADWTRNRLGAVTATDEATVRALVTAALRTHPEAEDVLHLAGAPGRVAAEFAARGCDVTVVDAVDAVDASEQLVETTDVELLSAALPELPPSRFDLVVAVDYTSRLAPTENRHLVAAAYDALAADGRFVVLDRLRGRSPTASDAAVEALATSAGGHAYAREDYSEWFADAGFSDAVVDDVPGTDRQAVVGRRPRDS
jgi:SAM-dependent methyltransferase